jgi:hypothetical protein
MKSRADVLQRKFGQVWIWHPETSGQSLAYEFSNSDLKGRNWRRPGVKTLLFVLMLSAVAGPVHAQSLRVTGETGYLSEWEVSGNVAQSISGRVREFSGSLTMKHVGLCSQAGPEEKVAEIRLQIAKSGLWPYFHAAMTMDGSKCTFGGKFSDTYSGLMDCADAKGVPITLRIK